MKNILILILSFLANICQAQETKDFSLSKVKSYSGKFVFNNLEPIDANTKAFFFENKLGEDATLEEKMIQSVNNAMKESGLQGGEPFDAIVIKDGEPRSKAIKFNVQSEKNSLAKVGTVQLGVYVFVDCIPSNEYDYIATINVKWHKDPDERDKAYLELIERGKKKYPNFDGIIFKDDHYKTADLIKFRGLELSGGGFRIGDFVLFGSGSRPVYGEVVQLDNVKQEASIKLLDEYGDEKIKRVNYVKLSPVKKEQYDNNLQAQKEEIALHQFQIGEKVTWVDGKNSFYGEITALNSKKHDAVITYLSVYGEEKATTRDFLKIDKLEEPQFQNLRKNDLEEIKKHQFILGEKVSFKNDKGQKVGEVTGLNNQSHKASIKCLDVFGEAKIIEVPYLEAEKTTEENYKNEIQKDLAAAERYKFTIGEKVNWSKSNLLGTKSETIPCEIIAVNDVDHKATVKYTNKENIEKQEIVSYLNLLKK